jgi:hypothetical protein
VLRSNCLIYALTAWLRAAPPGEESYLVIRRSRIRWGFVHFLHGVLDPATNQIEVTSYKPHEPEKRGFAPLFDGTVQRGDLP